MRFKRWEMYECWVIKRMFIFLYWIGGWEVFGGFGWYGRKVVWGLLVLGIWLNWCKLVIGRLF